MVLAAFILGYAVSPCAILKCVSAPQTHTRYHVFADSSQLDCHPPPLPLATFSLAPPGIFPSHTPTPPSTRPTEVSQLLATFDIDLEGNVDYNEWLAALIDWREVGTRGRGALVPGSAPLLCNLLVLAAAPVRVACAHVVSLCIPNTCSHFHVRFIRLYTPTRHRAGALPLHSSQVQESAGWQKYVNQVFDMFDQGHTGRLTPENIQRVLCGGGLLGAAGSGSSGSEADVLADPGGADAELDECPFDDVVPAAMREADEDHDGSISREEFVRFLSTAPGDKLEFYESRRKRLGGSSSGSDGNGGGGL